MYHEIPSIAEKDAFEMELTADVLRPYFTTRRGRQQFVENLVGYYVIMEGIFFYAGFAMMLSFHRQNRMTGIGEQFQYILRDETIHLNFGIDLINGIKAENPELWTADFQARDRGPDRAGGRAGDRLRRDCLPHGVLGLNADLFRDYVQLHRRPPSGAHRPPRQYGARNPFPWMSETIDLGKEKNFFETRVTEYRSGASLVWE